ncbi:MAG TPA: glycosyltransferase family 1 protein [Roseiflexaceae bacterium]|nr:glycosyltransferase family 1 protein [Roseiflexaceae bacterium]
MAFCEIFLNDNIISHSTQKGVTRFFNRVADGVINHFGSRVAVFSSQRRLYAPARRIRLPDRAGLIHDALASIAALVYSPAVVLSPYYGAMRTSAAEVFLVHDMIHELFPQHFPIQSSYERRFVAEKHGCLDRATLLLANSMSTARDIVHCYPSVDPRKIVITPLGVDDTFFSLAGAAPDFRGPPYLLYVGNRSVYKNFLRLLTAFGESGLGREVDLQVISDEGGGFFPEEQRLITRYGLERSVRRICSVSDAELRSWYASSIALVYPSEYEGFGLPILEALASGTLVATSNTASMPEVGGDVAFYFDPYSCESIAATLRQVVSLSSSERVQRIARGQEHARQFTWQRCQQRTIAALQALIEKA